MFYEKVKRKTEFAGNRISLESPKRWKKIIENQVILEF